MNEYKSHLFEEANVLFVEATENYEIGNFSIAEDLENRFRAIFGIIQKFGWAEEYMGIA